MDYWWPAKPHKWFESSLSTTTFAASLANPVTLRALQLRADVNQRSAANRASRLARLFTRLKIRYAVFWKSTTTLFRNFAIVHVKETISFPRFDEELIETPDRAELIRFAHESSYRFGRIQALAMLVIQVQTNRSFQLASQCVVIRQ